MIKFVKKIKCKNRNTFKKSLLIKLIYYIYSLYPSLKEVVTRGYNVITLNFKHKHTKLIKR